jgi:hypothetical protein
MKLVIMIIAWGIIGYVAACRFLAVREPVPPGVREPEPPCPTPPLYWKRIVAFVFGIIGGWIYYNFMGFKDPFTSIDFIASAVCAAALGRFIYLMFCPLR